MLKILGQLGGLHFIALTGAENFISSNDRTLTFQLPHQRTIDGSNGVRITLTAPDDYTVETLYVRRRGLKSPVVRSVRTGVCAENLPSVFTALTGLPTSL